MSRDALRISRTATVINKVSKKQEKIHHKAVNDVIKKLQEKYPNYTFFLHDKLTDEDAVSMLHQSFPQCNFNLTTNPRFCIRPDGGLVYVEINGIIYPVLYGERKRQGTNKQRIREGKKPQALGNGIERFTKNWAALRDYSKCFGEIFPYVCFADGCDFEKGSSIANRMIQGTGYGQINKIQLYPDSPFSARGSFFTREKTWTKKEQIKIMFNVANQAIKYYESK